jgi:type IV pilus assembly protein PilY1
MRPIRQHALSALTASLLAAFSLPANSVIGLMQVPPTAQIPPVPNVIVTLDDSGSMATEVPFDPTLTYDVPPNVNGTAFRVPPALPLAYSNAYSNANTVDLSITGTGGVANAYRTAYLALTTTAQRQNYANWYGFYRTRNMAMKASVMSAFSPAIIPDGRFRLAWQGLLASCDRGFNRNAATNCATANAIAPYEGTHRSNFYNWVQGVPASSSTPLRTAYRRVGEYLRTTGVNGPWADRPGTSEAPILSCRRSYHIMFTDGQWNDGDNAAFGNQDNTNFTLPDVVAYTQNRPYRGPTVGGNLTLSDVAMTYWGTDLQTGPGYDNNVAPVIKRSGTELYGTTPVAQYWNPKNNPATWQHLVTYAVGFGEAAQLNPASVGRPANVVPTFSGTTTGGASFAELVSGPREWPTTADFSLRQFDLWHAAVNSRGDMFPATDQRALNAAFQRIVAEILAQNTATGGAAASLAAVRTDFTVVRTGFESDPNFRGVMKGYPLVGLDIGTTPSWDAQTVMATQTPTSRTILTASSPINGVPFRWGNLSAFQQGALNRSLSGLDDGLGQIRLDFLRGATNNENSTANAGNPQAVLRDRLGARLGTIVNSEPRFVQQPRSGYTQSDYVAFRAANASRTPVVYVGANDGLLHGINGNTGASLLGYVPRGVYTRLTEYTDPIYQHKYFVDGPIMVGDIKDGTEWKSILVGALGAGGKGIFALDVTNPSAFTETNAASIVKFDYTSPADAIPTTPTNLATAFASENGVASAAAELNTDLGHIMGDPSRDAFIGRNLQISRMENDRWAVIVGNGVNSVNERPALYIFYLDGAGGFRKIVAENATGQNNGLSTPLPVDTDGDGKIDTVYAGDLRGRLWKFNLSASSDGSWGLAQSTPLVDTGRPITSAPAVVTHPMGGYLVTFGTGRLISVADKSSIAMDSIYGIWDKPGATGTVTSSQLVSRTVTATAVSTQSGSGLARVLSTATASRVDYSAFRGWKLDLGVAGERVIYNPIGSGSFGFFSTFVPIEGQTCSDSSQTGSILAFDVINGIPPTAPLIDINGDRTFNSGDSISDTQNAMGRARPVGKLVGLIDTLGNGNPAGGGGGGGGGGPGGEPPPGKCQAVGAAGSIDYRCFTGPGRRGWRDLTP